MPDTFRPADTFKPQVYSPNLARKAEPSAGRSEGDRRKTIRYPGPIPTALRGAAVGDGRLDLSRVTNQMITSLRPEERRAFGHNVSSATVFESRRRATPDGMMPENVAKNAASYLLDRLSGSATALLAANLGEGAEISGRAAEQINQNLSTFLGEMKSGSNGQFEGRQSRLLAKFAKSLTRGRGGEQKLRDLLTRLGPAVSRSGINADDTGLVVGSLLAGFRQSGVQVSHGLAAGIAADALSLTGLGKVAVVAVKAGLRAFGGATFGEDRTAASNVLRGEISNDLLRSRNRGDITRQDEGAVLAGIERGLNLNGMS